MMDKIFSVVIGVAAILFLIFLLVVDTYDELATTEVETYTIGCEVSQMAYAEEATGQSSTRPVYRMGVRNDDFATTLEISDRQFAQYVVGDVVEIEVTVYETGTGYIYNEYKLFD